MGSGDYLMAGAVVFSILLFGSCSVVSYKDINRMKDEKKATIALVKEYCPKTTPDARRCLVDVGDGTLMICKPYIINDEVYCKYSNGIYKKIGEKE